MLIYCKDDTQFLIRHFSKLPLESKVSLLGMSGGIYASKFNSEGSLKSDSTSKDRIATFDKKDAYAFYVDGELVGLFNFYVVKDTRVLSAYYIISKWYSGKGYGKKLISILLREAEKRMNHGNIHIPDVKKGHKFRSFELLIDDANIGSIKIIEPYSTVAYSGFMRGMCTKVYAVNMDSVSDIIQEESVSYKIDEADQIKDIKNNVLATIQEVVSGIQEEKMEHVHTTSSIESTLSEMEDLRQKESNEETI